ncbi:MAG: hypothetical protein M3680_02870 [Myxococcota bacterium]|nr:hypothetical protein [Myxococcota bacterium]
MIDLAMRVAEDEALPPAARLAALWPLVDRGFLKPPSATLIDIRSTTEPTFDVAALPLDQQRQLLELISRARALPEPDDGSEGDS